MRFIFLAIFVCAFACKGSPTTVEAQPPIDQPDEPVAEAPKKTGSVAELRDRASEPPRTSPNGQARVTHLAKGENAYMGYLVMEPKATVPVHKDPTEEYLYFLEGGGKITIDGTVHVVKKGMSVYMPAEAEVSYENGGEQSVVLQVFAGPGPSDKYGTWQVVGE